MEVVCCPYKACEREISIDENWERKTHVKCCPHCNERIFFDWCFSCESWNVIPVRVESEQPCKTAGCKNKLKVLKRGCGLCNKEASILRTAVAPEKFFCSECKQRGDIQKRRNPELEISENLTLVAQSDDKRRTGQIPGQTASRPGFPPPTTTGAAAFVGNRTAPADALGAKIDLLLNAVQELKAALNFYPNENLPKDLTESKLAALFHKIEFALLGPKDTEVTKAGKTVKTRKWTHVPSAIRKLLEESQKNQSAEEDEESPNKEGRGRLWGLGGSRPAKADNGHAPRDPTSDMTAAFDLVQQIQKLNLSLLKRIPDLMDAIEGSLEDEVQRHQSDGTIDGVGTVVEAVKERVDGQLANWLGVNGLIKEVPDTSEKYDPQRHDRDDDRPTKNSELDGLIHSVLQPGYRYDDGETQMVLRRPRVLVWYLE